MKIRITLSLKKWDLKRLEELMSYLDDYTIFDDNGTYEISDDKNSDVVERFKTKNNIRTENFIENLRRKIGV